MSARELAAAVGSDRQILRRLEERGLIATRSSRVRRAPGGSGLARRRRAARGCCPSRRRRSTAIVAALDGEAGAPRELLLHGVTGSGKTEVYLAAVEAALARGRGAIVLVPEIGLAPQAVARFRARLGDRFAVLHSALSAGERYDEWRRLRSGEASVCVGPRSAVFAPVHDLGLIVIDEEHDPSYKQEGDPCYDARAVARRRAAEQRRRARRRHRDAAPGDLAGAAAPGAAAPGRRPADAAGRAGRHARGRPALAARCTPTTWEALDEVRAAGAKAIVMINRRGFAPWLTCRSCGHHWNCPNCDVSLIVHRDSGPPRLPPLRPRRTAAARLPGAAPRPRSRGPAPAPSGSRRCCAERLAPMPVFRLDSDTAAGRGAHARILAAFGEAPSGVLVGTQMVAKGHDFPEVTLSAILDADATLRFPDFRAEERTFAMVAQLAGRSGRGEAGGEVIVQTLAPSAPSIEHAAAPRLGRLPRRRARAPPGAPLPALLAPDPDRPPAPSRRRGSKRAAAAVAADLRRGAAARTPTCSGRRRCSGSATATGAAS